MQSAAEHGEFVSYVEANGTQAGDGVMRIPGPIKHRGLCLRDVSIVGSFGVWMATGSSCEASAESFVSSLERHLKTDAKKGLSSKEPVAIFELPNGSLPKGHLVVHRGPPSFEAKHNATDKRVSYMCARQVGGTQ
jgi:hypothetical protein